jgi:hypothetical protein
MIIANGWPPWHELAMVTNHTTGSRDEHYVSNTTTVCNSAISRHARSALLRGHGPEHGQMILTEFILAVGPL